MGAKVFTDNNLLVEILNEQKKQTKILENISKTNESIFSEFTRERFLYENIIKYIVLLERYISELQKYNEGLEEFKLSTKFHMKQNSENTDKLVKRYEETRDFFGEFNFYVKEIEEKLGPQYPLREEIDKISMYLSGISDRINKIESKLNPDDIARLIKTDKKNQDL